MAQLTFTQLAKRFGADCLVLSADALTSWYPQLSAFQKETCESVSTSLKEMLADSIKNVKPGQEEINFGPLKVNISSVVDEVKGIATDSINQAISNFTNMVVPKNDYLLTMLIKNLRTTAQQLGDA